MIKALFLDLDQTLVDRRHTFQAYLSRQFSDLRLDRAGLTADDYYAAVHRWDDNGYRDKHDTFSRAIQELGLSLGPDLLMTHFKREYGQDARLFPGVYHWLESMAARWPLVLISNGRRDGQQVKLNVTGISPFFSRVLISGAEGIKKPDPEIYQRGCRALDVAPEEVLFVGDHPHNDVEVPIRLGMQAVWVRNPVYTQPAQCSAIVDSVTELDPQSFC